MRVTLGYSNRSNRNYRVRGATLQDVFDVLHARDFWGRYRSNSNWRSRGRDGVMTQLTIRAKPEITMPVWADKRRATRPEIKEWDRMHGILLRHERNHHKIFDDACKALKSELESGEDPDERTLQRRMDRFFRDTQGAQDSYDRRTRHGQTEGVRLTMP